MSILACLSLSLIVAESRRITSERRSYLYYPQEGESLSFLGNPGSSSDNTRKDPGLTSMGGGSVGVIPLDIKRYRVKGGDTLSGIAQKFGMDLDTVASLNREWGKGVHLVSVGEEIKIPNQDGIFLSLSNDFEGLCREKGIPPEVVLQANGVDREEVKAGMELFFPGVLHTGIERSVAIGAAFLRPVSGWVSSSYGYRRDPFYGTIRFHRGIDLAAPLGSPVLAAGDGYVAYLYNGEDGVLGRYLVLRHQMGYSTVYGHLSRVSVRAGQTVTRGQRIGSVGMTGMATGPHLHFELHRNGILMNPAGWISGIR